MEEVNFLLIGIAFLRQYNWKAGKASRSSDVESLNRRVHDIEGLLRKKENYDNNKQ